jgi:hypothetical protein
MVQTLRTPHNILDQVSTDESGMTDEFFLQSLWQYSLYRPEALRSTCGECITVVHPGKRNQFSGPDFEEARIRVADTLLVGSVELHIRSSDWMAHGHHRDPAYDRIILHVVWEDDAPKMLPQSVPVLELSAHVPASVLHRYRYLHESLSAIPCEQHLSKVNPLTKKAWLTRLLAERWEQRFRHWESILQQHQGDWRVLLYWRLAENFGFKTNAAPFLALAQSIPMQLLGRHHDQLFQLEALLFGQAGFLQKEFTEEYPFRLRQEYQFLRRKYRLDPAPVHLWKFMRLRPANFPTLRIAQFAMLIHRSFHLFQHIVAESQLSELTELFEGVQASEYWQYHFRFEDHAQKKPARRALGADAVRNIIVNTVAPLRFMFGAQTGIDVYPEQSLALLEGLEPERNALITEWERRGWTPVNAAESQGLLELFQNYCNRKRCLNCAIGHTLLRSGPNQL